MTEQYDPARPRYNQNSFTLETIQFGNINLQVYPNSNISFKILADLCINKEQKCLLDNLWMPIR